MVSTLRRPARARRSDLGEGKDGSHRIPVIDKMMLILELIEANGDGIGINALTTESRVPRSTVYRILNTLGSHGIVTREQGGDYKLGLRLAAMAAKVKTEISTEALVDIVHPKLVTLAQTTGETCKLSVLADDQAEVVDVVLGPSAMTPASRIGSRFAIHAGAASKALLAFSSTGVQERLLAMPMSSITSSTITDPDRMREEIAAINRVGASFDRGEWNPNVQAVAAPVFGIDGHAVAAISITFFSGHDAGSIEERVAGPLLETASEVSARLGYRK